jgi:probable HAF family extracellular repeat protein
MQTRGAHLQKLFSAGCKDVYAIIIKPKYQGIIMKSYITIATLITFIANINLQSQVQYQVINLGTLGGSLSQAYGISNAGQVVGRAHNPDNQGRAFLWQNGTMTDLGTLGGDQGEAYGINNTGQVVGGARNPDNQFRAFLWQNGTMTDLGTLGGDQSEAWGINNAGQVVGLAQNADNQDRAFLWQNGTMTDLGTFGGNDGHAYGINNAGQVVGRAQNADDQFRAFLWQNGTMTDLGTFGGNYGQAYGINNAGQVVGLAQNTDNQGRAFLWHDGTMTDLGTLGGNTSLAWGINDTGQVVGRAQNTDNQNRAFLWQDGTMTDLNDLIDSSSGWILQFARAINDSGQIVGYGNYNGATRAFLLNPQRLNVTNPLSDLVWIAGEKDTIKWNGGSANQNLNIYLSTNYENGSGTFNSIVQNYPADSGKYIWQIPDTILSRKCVIKIEDANDTSTNVKSGVFKIKPYVLTKINPVDSNYVAFKMSSDKWSFGNSANNLWPNTWWNQFDYVFGTDPYTDEQYPPDFPAAVPWAFPDWPLFVQTFGTNQCYWSTFLGIYKEAATLKWKNMNSNWGGSCSGFSVSSLMAFTDKDRFRNHYPGINNFNNLIALDTSVVVRNLLNELWIHYFGRQHSDHLVNNWGKTPVQTLTEIKNMFREDNNPAYLYIANNGAGGGAHAIVPYKVTKHPVNNFIEYIHVYDNSYHTDETATIIVNTSVNGGNGSWAYANWAGWGGNSKLILMDSVNSYYQTPIFNPDPAAYYAPGRGINYLESYNSPNSDFLITDTLGRSSGFANNELLNGIPEVVPNFPPKPELSAPIGYFLPEQEYSIQMKNFQDSSSYFSLFFPDLIYEYSREDALNSQTDLLIYKDGLGISSNDNDEKVIELKTVSISSDNEKVFSVKNITVLNNDSLFFQNEQQNKLLLKNYESDKNYDLSLKYLTANDKDIFEYSQISLGNNSSHHVVPDWNDLQNQPVKILIDLGNNGTIDDSIFVKNQATDVEDKGSLLSPESYNLAQNYPNPFNPVTTISYSIPQRSNVILKIYDILGNEVAVLISGEKDSGVYTVNFDASQFASGIYFYKIQAGSFTQVKKMILLK